MKVIALLPVRNESWVLRHSLACLSGFCDVVLVGDQASTDRSRDICREFPNVVLLESATAQICEQARWRLWDAARDFDGDNLIWCTDADEVVSPGLARAFLERDRDRLTPGTVVECRYYHAWNSAGEYRTTAGAYAPHWKPVAVVDDRRMDYSRARALPLHEERVPVTPASRRIQADEVPVIHLQWLLPRRTQVRQAWYRGREWMQQERSAAAINDTYSRTLPSARVVTAPIPARWVEDVTVPDPAADRNAPWQEAELLEWFAELGPAYFEPLEIWHVDTLGDAFRRREGRAPKPDRSYRPTWPDRAKQFGRRLARAVRRRLPI